jgi:hypothetical protein
MSYLLPKLFNTNDNRSLRFRKTEVGIKTEPLIVDSTPQNFDKVQFRLAWETEVNQYIILLPFFDFGFELFGFVNGTIVKYYDWFFNCQGNKTFHELNKSIRIEWVFLF